MVLHESPGWALILLAAIPARTLSDRMDMGHERPAAAALEFPLTRAESQ